MSSFFTLPSSQRKRKREQDSIPSNKRRDHSSKPSTALKSKTRKQSRDESISGSDSDEADQNKSPDLEDASSESGSEDETAAERRLRLAERYLENVKEQIQEEGFDAEDVDKELIASRLREDVAETKGRMYRHLAANLKPEHARKATFGHHRKPVTAISCCPPYMYTATKDMVITKWKPAKPPSPPPPSTNGRQGPNPQRCRPDPLRKSPVKVKSTRGDKPKAKVAGFQHHTGAILAIAASADGKYVCTGGADKRLIIWSAADLKPLKVFMQHRDAITGLSFRLGTNQLYSCSKDRSIKVWSLDELAYIETLFGHQDEVVDVASLALERCVSVGARDRTARLWKVVEEQQLVYRGGTSRPPKVIDSKWDELSKAILANPKKLPVEGSIDRVAMVDESTFLTGSDNGTLALWDINKKKPIFSVPLAHGVTLPDSTSAEDVAEPVQERGEPQPCWITALATLPLTDIAVSGSWDGQIKMWKINEDKKSFNYIGSLGYATEKQRIRGVVNDLHIFERGHSMQDGIGVLAAVGREHRLGRWKHDAQWTNEALVYELLKYPE